MVFATPSYPYGHGRAWSPLGLLYLEQQQVFWKLCNQALNYKYYSISTFIEVSILSSGISIPNQGHHH